MVDVTTANVTALRTGTGWTLDVTAVNLDADLSVKDFLVLHDNALVANTSYQKTARVTLTYVGAALPANTIVEIRRRTPVAPITTVTFGNKFSSGLWNAEIERRARWQAEVELNGSGLSGLGLPIPKNDAYSALWQPDIVFPPTRQTLYNKFETMAPLNGAAFTSNPTVPNILSVVSNTQVPNTKYISDFYAPTANPIMTGNVSVPTRATGDSTTGAASTAFVQGEFNARFARYTQAISARASAALTTGDTIINAACVLTRANPTLLRVVCNFAATASTPYGVGWILNVNGTERARSFFYSEGSGFLHDINLAAYVLPLALTASSQTVTVTARVFPATSVAWSASTAFIEFVY